MAEVDEPAHVFLSSRTATEARTSPRANDRQPGGNHYKQFGDLQPWDVILHFGLGFLDGNAVKYLLRWRHKGGLQDLEKAAHFIEKLIETEKLRANQDKT